MIFPFEYRKPDQHPHHRQEYCSAAKRQAQRLRDQLHNMNAKPFAGIFLRHIVRLMAGEISPESPMAETSIAPMS
jgi:hypothetical protein